MITSGAGGRCGRPEHSTSPSLDSTLYAPGLNPLEGIWSSLKRGPLANVSFTGFAHLLQVIKRGLRKIQHQPALIEGCLAGTGLSLERDEPTS